MTVLIAVFQSGGLNGVLPRVLRERFLLGWQAGDPKDTVKNSVHGILKTLWRIYPASRLFPYVMEGVKTKNARQRTGDFPLFLGFSPQN